MTTASMLALSVIATVLLGASALADPQQTRSQTDAAAPVLVIRGTEQQAARQTAPAVRKPSATRSTSESGVIVDRPDPAGFLRETSRLAAQAEANEQRAAQQQSREKDRQLTETLRALEDAARAVEDEARTRSERYIPVYYPPPKPPSPIPK
jgi:hypothetical protein